MAELDDDDDDDDEDDEFPQTNDIPDISPVVPNGHPNPSEYDRDGGRGLDEDKMIEDEEQPMDESEAYGMSNADVSYRETSETETPDTETKAKTETEGSSNYESIGIGAKTQSNDDDENDNEDEINDGSKTGKSAPSSRGSSPSKSVSFRDESKSPMRKRSTEPHAPRKELEVDSHVDDVIDIPDPSPRLDLLSPISGVSSLGNSPPMTPSSSVGTSFRSQNSYTKSTAMRGAQKLLKKNREQRLAIMAKRRNPNADALSTGTSLNTTANSDNENDAPNSENKGPKTIYSRSRGRAVTPIRHMKSPPESPAVIKKALTPSNKKSPAPAPAPPPASKVKMSMYKSTSKAHMSVTEEGADDSKSDATSGYSGTSSIWTDSTDVTGRDSRRALILKMAKSRMKKKKEEESVAATDN